MPTKTYINGKYADAIIYSSDIIAESGNQQYITTDAAYAIAQIRMLCNNEALSLNKIRIMPDVHPGKVGPIGFTMVMAKANPVIPSLLGVDIGCGVLAVKVDKKKIEFQKLDSVIRENIPSGFKIRDKAHNLSNKVTFINYNCRDHINENKAILSIGTLGGGNHFIEVDKDSEDNLWIVIHSGSRHLGVDVTEYYMKEGNKILKEKGIEVPYELTYLEDDLKTQYLNDVQLASRYAAVNREAIMYEILKGMKLKEVKRIESVHNFIRDDILRKGAISAYKGEDVIIPINMRDGVIIGKGLGNQDWNYSAPHGAGRVYSRTEVKNYFTLSSFKKEMKGVYSTCINDSTLDESPFAYRNIDTIKKAITNTVSIKDIMKPIYNFKAGSKK